MKRRTFRKKDFNSLLRDKEVIDEIKGLESLQVSPSGTGQGGLERYKPKVISPAGSLEAMFSKPANPGGIGGLEAIVMTKGRPALLIKDNTFVEPELNTWKQRLSNHSVAINGVIPSVARVELLNSPDYDYVGTAWVVDEGVMVTNRHVANVFARKRNGEFVIKHNPNWEPYEVQVDFKEEHGNVDSDAIVYEVVKVLHIEPNNDYAPDMAFIQVKSEGLPEPMIFDHRPIQDQDFIGVVGYPAYDSRNDSGDMNRIFGGIYNVKRLSPGMISEAPVNAPYFLHDCTTLGGNSGSLVFNLDSGKAVGLHFAGRFLDANYAVRAEVIQHKLLDLSARNFRIETPLPLPDAEEAIFPSSLADRKGYDPDFLNQRVPLPELDASLDGKLAPLIESEDTELKYQHFSIVMHAQRKMALYTVSNIDGNKMFGFVRGRDKWYFDPRMDDKYQAGQALYTKNDFHRGHLVRRLDPVWGDHREDAKKAMLDTFFWTNCTPQHRSFNPRSWLGLEDYILNHADTGNIKVTLFTGPIFKETDQEYRGHLIPEEYWKVAIVDNQRTGKLSATAYMLSQKEFIGDMEFVFGQYKTYQIPLSRVEEDTGLRFGLTEFDPMATSESVIRVINFRDDILL